MQLTLSAIFWGVITFSLLVVLHEGGHFLVAKAFGVKVHEFFVGLPGPSLSFKRGETRFGVTAIPLGGYVRIAGMEGDTADERLPELLVYITEKRTVTLEDIESLFSIDEREAAALLGVLVDWDAISYDEHSAVWNAGYEADSNADAQELHTRAISRTYLSLTRPKRVAMLLAGVTVNIVVAVAVFAIVLSGWGYYADQGNIELMDGHPAASAGLMTGDKVLSVANEPVAKFEDIVAVVSTLQPGDSVDVAVERKGSEKDFTVTLGTHPETGKAYLGVAPQLTKVRPNVIEAVGQAFGYVWLTAKALVGFFNPSTFAESAKQSTSIVGISVMAARAAQSSALDYAWLVAAISLSLGIMNVLPIPPLDGGKVLMEIIGGVRKRDVSIRVQTGASLAGFALLFALMIFLTWNDISRLIN